MSAGSASDRSDRPQSSPFTIAANGHVDPTNEPAWRPVNRDLPSTLRGKRAFDQGEPNALRSGCDTGGPPRLLPGQVHAMGVDLAMMPHRKADRRSRG